jgi:hypothetical protein
MSLTHILSYVVLAPPVLVGAWVLTKERGIWLESPYRRHANIAAILWVAVLFIVCAFASALLR